MYHLALNFKISKLAYCLLYDQVQTGKSQDFFGPKKTVLKLQSTFFEKLIFSQVFNVGKTKRIRKFDDLESQHCKDIKGMVVPKIGPKSFGAFEKQALDSQTCKTYFEDLSLLTGFTRSISTCTDFRRNNKFLYVNITTTPLYTCECSDMTLLNNFILRKAV